MNKKIRLTAVAAACTLVFCTAGCSNGEKDDHSRQEIEGKTSIYVDVTDGGYGYDWLEEIAVEWENLKENEDYHIIVKPSINQDPNTVIGDYQSGKASNIYMWSHNVYSSLVKKDYLEDLTDMLSVKPDGDKTIEELLIDPEGIKKSFSFGQSGKLYGLPFGDGPATLIFDYGTFVDNDWLFWAKNTDEVKASLTAQGIEYEVKSGEIRYVSGGGKVNYLPGDRIAACGKDGKYGTYDDGQPVNLAEWKTLLENICDTSNSYPFVYTSKYANYVRNGMLAVLAQYAGTEAYETFINYSGSYTDSKGTHTVTFDKGYEVYDMEGFSVAANFMKDSMFTQQNVYPASWKSNDFSHRDAQNKFLLGYQQSAAAPTAAMLFDGVWWENEAKPMFNSLEERGMSDRAYGKRDYRVMLFPDLEGQTGANGDGTGSVLEAMDNGSCFIMKNSDPKITEKCKSFLVYTLKRSSLAKFTVKSGCVRPYKYTLTDAEYESLTPFGKNFWDCYNDRENITVVREGISNLNSLVNMYTTHDDILLSKIGTMTQTFFKAMTDYSANAYIEGVKNYNTGNWSTWYAQIPADLK